MPVTVYSDVNYQGKSATLEEGRHKLDPSMNDSISSVRVPYGWSVTLYDNADFTGNQTHLTSDTAKVPDVLHDKASSIDVFEVGVPVSDVRQSDGWFYFEDNPSE